MKGLLRFLLLAFVLIMVGIWILTVAKSCNNPVDSTISTIGDATEAAGETIADGAEAVADGVRDLTTDDEADESEFDEAEFDEDGNEVLEEDDGDEDEAETTADDDMDERTITSSNSNSSSGKYLVVSGAFLGETNANQEVSRLKKLGYSEAEVVVFDFSQYHSVCVKRTNSLSEARSLKNQLDSKHNIEAYVHRKRSKRK